MLVAVFYTLERRGNATTRRHRVVKIQGVVLRGPHRNRAFLSGYTFGAVSGSCDPARYPLSAFSVELSKERTPAPPMHG